MSAFTDFLGTRAQELLGTDLNQIRFADIGMTYLLSMAVTVVVVLSVLRLWLTSRRHHRQHSGHVIEPRFRRGVWKGALYNLPKLLLGLAVAGLLVAMADPYLTATEEVAGDMDSRIRIDLVDTSLSMAWEFPGSGKSRAQVAREAHLEFLEMRRDKNDRVALWLFSSFPYMVDDFVIDDELYFFQVMDAPYAIVRILAAQSGTPIDQMFVPEDKVRIIDSEGNTNIVRALQSVVRHFDRDVATLGSGAPPHRAVLIVTDADVDEIPDAEFAELSRRNIVPYMIFINADDSRLGAQRQAGPPVGNTQGLIDTIREFGGDYFDVTDADGLQRAYEAIDEAETVQVQLSHRAVKVPIYSRFLLISMALLVVGIPAGFVAELIGGTHP
ncbi:MAG: vWA domain-containing protein [bacterium]